MEIPRNKTLQQRKICGMSKDMWFFIDAHSKYLMFTFCSSLVNDNCLAVHSVIFEIRSGIVVPVTLTISTQLISMDFSIRCFGLN